VDIVVINTISKSKSKKLSMSGAERGKRGTQGREKERAPSISHPQPFMADHPPTLCHLLTAAANPSECQQMLPVLFQESNPTPSPPGNLIIAVTVTKDTLPLPFACFPKKMAKGKKKKTSLCEYFAPVLSAVIDVP
jgi:hypothetical protein